MDHLSNKIKKRRHEILARYSFEWDGLINEVINLKFNEYEGNEKGFCWVKLPSFSNSYGLDENKVLFPKKYVMSNKEGIEDVDYRDCNWIQACDYLSSLSFEKDTFLNSLMSLSKESISPELFEKAWVNRYLLFLRDWAALKANKNNLIGKVNTPEIILTHDVDAIKVSKGLKLRQFVQNKQIINLKNKENLNMIEEIMKVEKNYGFKSIFFISGNRISTRIPLADPSYGLDQITDTLSKVIREGFEIGLHPGIFSSKINSFFSIEKNKLEKYSKVKITKTRNHWLANSKNPTWKIYSKNDICEDFSIGYNDLPGFRNLTALKYKPNKYPVNLISMFAMDGQYLNFGKKDVNLFFDDVKKYIIEIINVGGVSSINTHQRLFHEYYGFMNIYISLLEYLNNLKVFENE